MTAGSSRSTSSTPAPTRRARKLQARVERLNHAGHGVVFHEGRPLVVPHTDIGERVAYRVHEGRRRVGELLDVLEPSPHRVDPGCEQAARCPGCPLRSLSAERQASHQAAAVRGILKRIAGVDVPVTVHAPLGRDDYRAHATARPLGEVLGLAPHFGAPIDLTRCPAQTPEVRALLARLRLPDGVEQVAVQAHGEQRRVVLLAREGRSRLARGDRRVELEVEGDRLGFTWPAWTPQSPGSVPVLRRLVMEMLAPGAGDDVLEVGCGSGTLSAPLARAADSLLGIDYVREATRDAAALGLPGATFQPGRADRALRRLVAKGRRFDLALLHAMRRPFGAAAMEALSALRPRRVLYLAPSAASLARDLLALPRYRVRRVEALDQLPGTSHVLTACVLE